VNRPIHRRRRPISRPSIRRLGWLFRYSMSRDAYILKGVGGWVGPVFKVVDLGPGEPPPTPLDG
jgi:hypothetical protein